MLLFGLLIIALVFEQTSSQGGCGNPLVKLNSRIKSLGAAVPLDKNFTECGTLLNVTCCDKKYHTSLIEKFNETRSERILYFDRLFVAKFKVFMSSFQDFLTWYDKNEKSFDNSTVISSEIAHYNWLLEELQIEKGSCFQSL